jgi:hypothetical protein
MQGTVDCAAAGDIPGCMEMQRRANECLRRHGIDSPDLPEAYFALMHESIGAARDGDMVGARLIGERMNELLLKLGIVEPEPEIEWPEECLAIEAQIEAAEASGDFMLGLKLLREFGACLKRHGLPSPDMPEEWYVYQEQIFEAQQRGDHDEARRLQALCDKLSRDAGVDV